MDSERRERVFIVRLWTGGGAAPRAGWRGSVQDVAAQRTFYVGNPREVTDYLVMALSELEAPLDERPGMDKPPAR